jgi:hypothetical protein
VGAEIFHAEGEAGKQTDGKTDKHDEAFSNFANAAKTNSGVILATTYKEEKQSE